MTRWLVDQMFTNYGNHVLKIGPKISRTPSPGLGNHEFMVRFDPKRVGSRRTMADDIVGNLFVEVLVIDSDSPLLIHSWVELV